MISLAITSLVLLAFLHGAPRGRLTSRAARLGRWLLVGGIGGWLGFLVVSRLSLLVDRIGVPARRLAYRAPMMTEAPDP